MDWCEAMRVRRSERTYLDKQIPADLLDKLLADFAQGPRLNDLRLRLPVVPATQVEHAMLGLIGGYGKVVGPPLYAIGISQNGESDKANFGYALERFVLNCTRAGLGTCWVGGYFKATALDEAVPQESDERIICITPLGYAAPRRFAERTMRTMGGLNRRKPLTERVFAGQWGEPLGDYLASRPKLAELFELARWSPSASNKQPTHYVVDERRIVVTVLTTLLGKYPAFAVKGRAPDLDFQPVDAGIAMCHLDLAAAELGMAGGCTPAVDKQALRQEYQIAPEADIIGVFEFAG